MDDPLLNLPGYVMRRASAAWQADLAGRLAALDLRPADASVLLLIDANPGITQSDLCRALDIQRANMTPLTSRLEERVLVRRLPADGRSFGLELTADGAALVADVRKAVAAHEAALIARVPPEHRPHLLPALLALWTKS